MIQHGDVSQHSNVSLWWRDILQPRNAFNHGSDAINGFYAAARSNGDPSVLNCPQIDAEDDHPILRREVEAAVQSLKKGKSAGVDNIPAELVHIPAYLYSPPLKHFFMGKKFKRI